MRRSIFSPRSGFRPLSQRVGPFVAILLAGPVLAVFGYAVHLALISRVSGTRTSSLEGDGHYAQLILTLASH